MVVLDIACPFVQQLQWPLRPWIAESEKHFLDGCEWAEYMIFCFLKGSLLNEFIVLCSGACGGWSFANNS